MEQLVYIYRAFDESWTSEKIELVNSNVQSTALERLIFAYGVVAAIVCCAYAYNFTVSDYQHGPKALGVGLIIASVFAFKKFLILKAFTNACRG